MHPEAQVKGLLGRNMTAFISNKSAANSLANVVSIIIFTMLVLSSYVDDVIEERAA